MHRHLKFCGSVFCFVFCFVSSWVCPSTAQIVQIRPVMTDTGGTPISTIAVGEEFLLNLFVQDLRADPQGVFSAFADVTYDAGLFGTNGVIVVSPTYSNGVSGEFGDLGLIDELGAVDGITPLGGDEVLLISVVMNSNNVLGTGLFELDPADVLPGSETTVYGLSAVVPSSDIQYLSTSLMVVPEPVCLGWLLIMLPVVARHRGY